MNIPIVRRLWSSRRDIIGAAMYWSGAGHAFELAMRPTGAIILMYHSVAQAEAEPFVEPRARVSPDMFERQMLFLSTRRSVVPLSRLVEDISSGVSPPAGTVCITFDDGYLDNLTTAAPILETYRLPATLFLATGYIERGEMQWADNLHWLLNHRTSDLLSLPSIGLQQVNVASCAQREGAYTRLHSYLLEAGRDARVRLLAEAERQLVPFSRPPRLTMNWDEVRELRRRYPFFEIGGHTRDHVDLQTHRGETARSQITGCADDLRRELCVEPGNFSFPYARWCTETRDIVNASGWKSAVGVGDRFRITPASDRFAMPRVESPGTMTELRFKTSGAYPGALSMVGLR